MDQIKILQCFKALKSFVKTFFPKTVVLSPPVITSVIELPNISVPTTVNSFEVKSLPEVIVTVDPFTRADTVSVPICTSPIEAEEGVIVKISLNSTEPLTVPELPFIISVLYIPSLSYPATVNVFPVSSLENVN